LIANKLLAVANAPAGRATALLFSTAATQTPFGNGFLCFASPTPVAVGLADGNGTFAAPLDLTTGALGQLTAGDTARFQASRPSSATPASAPTSDRATMSRSR